MMRRRATTAYLLLALAWLLIAGWQGIEHIRFRAAARESLLARAHQIGSTLSDVIRSQGRFGMVRQERLEDAIKGLAQSNELQAVMLLNAEGQVVASAGQPIELNLEDLLKQGMPRWGKRLVTITDLIDLGARAQDDLATSTLAIVIHEGDLPRPPRNGKQGRPPGGPEGPPNPDGPPLPPNPDDMPTTEAYARFRAALADPKSTVAQALQRQRREFEERRRQRRPPSFVRPFWMSEAEYRRLIEKQGLHGFVLQVPTEMYRTQVRHDLWIRATTLAIAFLAVGGLGVAWRNMERMSRLQLRLLRASEMNAHLQELNVAAAGLAHETRNPLNIVRGSAQLISQQADLPVEIRRRAAEITEEVDRVTGRLNEFINYSRSPEPRPSSIRLRDVIGDVQRALDSDLADKAILFAITGPDLHVEADESLLRQVLFNLLLNAIQAVGPDGRVEAAVRPNGSGEVALEIRDDGPGVPPDLRQEIFKPYFTTRTEGTGLGLAVVRQIVLAHHWEIEYTPGFDDGAGFRVSGLKAPGRVGPA